MSDDVRPRDVAGGMLNRRHALVGLAAATGVVAVGVTGVGEGSGWFDSQRLTSTRFVNRFEKLYGKYDGFRRNHAKGVAATGVFDSTGAGSEVSEATILARGAVPIVARFSMSGTVPNVADDVATIRGFAVMFQHSDGQQWRTAMVNIPVFPDSTPQGFYDRILASSPDPATGKADPNVMAAFLRRHPETVAAMKILKASPPSPAFADSTFHGLNAFIATNQAGASVPIRWAAVPVDPIGRTTATPSGGDALFDALVERVRQAPVSWRLVLTVAEPGDPTHDPTIPWPRQRRTIDTGTITIDTVLTEARGNARDVNFDPTVLPVGLRLSDDPLPPARSAVYARSFERRSREPKSPSEVDVAQVKS